MVLNRRSLLATTGAIALVPAVFSQARAATPKGVLVMAKTIDDVVGGFDPAEAYETTNYEVCANLYRTLVMVDPKDTTKVIGNLARAWDVSTDGSTMTFHLIGDAKFDSGKPVTVEDAAFSLQRVMKLGKGPSEIFTQFGWTADNVDKLIQAGADGTLTITLPNKLAPGIVLTSLATPTGCVVEKAVVLSHVAGDDFGNGWLRTHSAGAGAYRLVEWQAGDHLVLAANPHATVAPKIPRIVFRHVSDAATQLLLLERGDVDIARDLGSDQLAAIGKNSNLDKVSSDTLTQMYLGMNMSVPEFQKPEVREAIRWAINYEAIAKNVTPGTWNVSQSFEPKGIPGAITGNFRQDIPKAKALLAQAGLPDGFSVTLDYFSSKPYSDVAQAIQADLAAIGIRVELLAGETAQYLLIPPG